MRYRILVSTTNGLFVSEETFSTINEAREFGHEQTSNKILHFMVVETVKVR